MWGISIHGDFRPMWHKLSCYGSLGLGKNLLCKSVLGHCERRVNKSYVNKSKVSLVVVMKWIVIPIDCFQAALSLILSLFSSKCSV